MEQRDLLKDQIDQLGKVLAKILADFLGLKAQGKASQGIEITHQRLQSELDIDIEKLSSLSKEELKSFFANRPFTAEHLEILSDFLKEAGMEEMGKDKITSKIKLEKAIELLDLADAISKTASFQRINKKKELEKVLAGDFR